MCCCAMMKPAQLNVITWTVVIVVFSYISQTTLFKSKGNEKFKPLKINIYVLNVKSLFSSEHTIKASHFVAEILFRNIKRFGYAQLWPLAPKVAGSNPAEAVGFLRT
jgi:hypothetical protein